jgi:hypothetical protein
METDPNRPEREDASSEDESVEEFREDMENDPSRASSGEADDTDLDRLRGG